MRIACVAAVAAVLVLMTGQHIRAQDETVYDGSVKVVSFQRLWYPGIARSSFLHGAVVVRVTLGDDGAVSDAVALSGHKLLIGYVLENVKAWKFKPSEQKRAIIVYEFTIDGPCHNANNELFRLSGNVARLTTCAPLNW